MKSISIYFPFRAIFPVDPRKLQTVGDQVLCEHLFAFHANETFKGGFVSSFSKVEINSSTNEVWITPKFFKKEDGKARGQLQDLVANLESVFRGTTHFPYSTLLRSIDIIGDSVRILFSKIPINLKYLFTLPDLSLFDAKALPILTDRPFQSTGPYLLKKWTPASILLEMNPEFPSELRANQIQEVEIKHYSMSHSEELVLKMEHLSHPLVYFNGASFLKKFSTHLSTQGYRIHTFPAEWIAYWGISEKLPLKIRKILRSAVGRAKSDLHEHYDGVLPAISTVPSDRPYSLSLDDLPLESSAEGVSDFPLEVAVYEKMLSLPVVTLSLTQMKKSFPKSMIRVISVSDFSKLKSIGHTFVDLVGMSPADPLSHLSYLASDDPIFRSKLKSVELTRLSQIDDQEDFVQEVKRLERKIYEEVWMIPVAHFPGIVAEAPQFERVDSLAGNWGIQTWAYRIH